MLSASHHYVRLLRRQGGCSTHIAATRDLAPLNSHITHQGRSATAQKVSGRRCTLSHRHPDRSISPASHLIVIHHGFIHQESDTVPANITHDRPGTYSTSARLYRYPMAHGCEGGCRGNHIAVAHDALSGSQAASESAPDPYQSIQPLAASAVRRQAPETRPCRAPDFAVPDARHAHAARRSRR